MIRWAPWEGVASRLAAEPLAPGGAGIRMPLPLGQLDSAGAGTTSTAWLPCVS